MKKVISTQGLTFGSFTDERLSTAIKERVCPRLEHCFGQLTCERVLTYVSLSFTVMNREITRLCLGFSIDAPTHGRLALFRNDGTYQPFKHNVHIYLDEQDNRTADQRASLKANGFTEYTSVKDYPVRNRLLTLHIRRRRYLDAEDRSVILSEFPLKADGTSISPEFADFLKRRS